MDWDFVMGLIMLATGIVCIIVFCESATRPMWMNVVLVIVGVICCYLGAQY